MLEEQRQKASFDKKELSYVIHGGPEGLEKFLKTQKTVTEDPILKFNPLYMQAPRSQTMTLYAKKLLRYHEVFPFDYYYKLREQLFFSEQMPLSLHFYMFMTTLNNLCSEEQEKMFLQPALKGEILGCYAQTELGHGSDVQSLMTTATYDTATQSFIIDSNGTAGAKWWIGDLGVYANHAIVFANLIINNKKHGIHAFLTPIRDQNHKLYPGVEAGDVGPKYGYNNKDNGYAIFTQYRIPRMNMLMRYSKVQKNGDFSRRGNEKISYATMLITRSLIPVALFFGFSKACTIITRYSLVRSQFKDSNGKQIPIFNYQIQQQKIIPRIAQAFANFFGAEKITETAIEVFDDAKQKGVFDKLNEAHAITSGAKAILTNDALRGMEILRRAAGGHGFLMASGLPGVIQEFAPTVTYEGQNTVLFLQVARFLLKSFQDLQKGKRLTPTVMYLEEINNQKPFILNVDNEEQLRNPETIRKIFLYHSCYRVKKAGQKLAKGLGQGLSPKDAWDHYAGLELVEAGTAHSYLWMYQNFYEKIYLKTKNERARAVLIKLLLLYGLEKIVERSSSFYEMGVITSSTLKNIQNLRERLFTQIRPDALTIVESFEYDDNTLHSAIGCADGNVYERLLDWSKNYNVVNKEEVRKELVEEIKKAKSQLKPKL